MPKISHSSAALSGLKVLELAAIGPIPFAGMMLADMGADVTRIDRVQSSATTSGAYAGFDNRGRRSIAIDLKNPAAAEVVLRLVEKSDALIEGFRPGVMERLGLGPDICLARNSRLLYGRMTGWGQTGPLSQAAGHDLNYIAITGALHAMGSDDRPPTPPLNIVGDYAGGGAMLVIGLLGALIERHRSGKGQIIDAAMIDGVANLMSPIYSMLAQGLWRDQRASNQLDGAAHYYGAYECADGLYVTIGSLEPRFYRLLLEKCGVDSRHWPPQADPTHWPAQKARLVELFATRTRAQWCELLEGTDVCFAPVLSMTEAQAHPHNRARNTFIEVNGKLQPAPAPRLSRTPSIASSHIAKEGEDTNQVLADCEFSRAEITGLLDAGVVQSTRY